MPKHSKAVVQYRTAYAIVEKLLKKGVRKIVGSWSLDRMKLYFLRPSAEIRCCQRKSAFREIFGLPLESSAAVD